MHDNKHERNHALLRSSASGIHAARYTVLRNKARCTARCDDRVSRCTLKRTNHTSLLGKLDNNAHAPRRAALFLLVLLSVPRFGPPFSKIAAV